jgi:hypothetical protein
VTSAVVTDHDYGIYSKSSGRTRIAHSGNLMQDFDSGITQDRKYALGTGPSSFDTQHTLFSDDLQLLL